MCQWSGKGKRVMTMGSLTSNEGILYMNDANYDKWRESAGSLINPDEPEPKEEEVPRKEVICSVCGMKITAPIIDDVFGLDTWSCDRCIAEYDKRIEEKKKALIVPRHVTWANKCPKQYQDTSFDHPNFPKSRFLGRINTWKYSNKGLLLAGPTGQGKSRSMFKLLERLFIEDHFEIEIKYPEEFEWEIVDACKGNDSERASKLLDRLSEAPILAIDDFLAAKTTERVRGFFFGLFDKRIRNHRPIFITTQLTQKEVVNKLSDHNDPASIKTAEAFLRRLKENTKILRF